MAQIGHTDPKSSPSGPLDLNPAGARPVDGRVMVRRNQVGRATVATVAVVAAAVVVAVARGGGEDPAVPIRPAAFDWLHPRAIPFSWSALRVPESPAQLPLPTGWKQARGDAGTRTAELEGPSGGIAGYLNATPRQGEETLANWPEFRPDHNRDEGDRDVRLLASAPRLRFRSGTGSCVLDSYLTTAGRRYREIACIVAGRSASTVVVAAAAPRRWATEAPVLERAVAGFET